MKLSENEEIKGNYLFGIMEKWVSDTEELFHYFTETISLL